MQWWIWLSSAGLLLVVEMLTVDLLFASLAFSALIAAGVSVITSNTFIQALVFAFAAVISIFLLRPIALRNLRKSSPEIATNVDALIGAEAVTLSSVDGTSGEIKLSGEVWSARTRLGRIEKSTRVIVLAIEGATALVKAEGENNGN
jgi:membrane protein implicated in regulation of membrane protease activity